MGHFYKQYKFMTKIPSEMLWLVYPLITILSLGIFASFIISKGGPTDTLLFIFVGFVAWNMYDISQRAITFAITFDIWDGCMKHSMITSSRIKDFVIGNALFGLLTSVIGTLGMGLIGFLLFNFNIFSIGIYLILALPVIFIFATAFGLIVNSLMITKSHHWMALIWISGAIMMIFSGVFYPISVLPEPVQIFSYALPTTHGIDAMRSAYNSSFGAANTSIIYGFVLSIIYLVITYYIFKKAIRHSKKTGVMTWY